MRGEERWFQLRATRFGTGETMRLVLAHENITEIMQAEQALRRLAGRLLRTQDEERRRIARDLHNSTAQNLLGATLESNAPCGCAAPGGTRQGRACDSQALIEQSQQEIRTVSYLLHPPMLDEMGLPSALRWYMEGFTKRSGIAIEISVAKPIEGRRFPFDIEAALFRVLQECMTNVHRHSGSTTARIEMLIELVSPRAERLVLRVEDRGKGMLVAARGRTPPADGRGFRRGVDRRRACRHARAPAPARRKSGNLVEPAGHDRAGLGSGRGGVGRCRADETRAGGARLKVGEADPDPEQRGHDQAGYNLERAVAAEHEQPQHEHEDRDDDPADQRGDVTFDLGVLGHGLLRLARPRRTDRPRSSWPSSCSAAEARS